MRGREGGRGEEEKRNSSHTIIHPSQGSWEVAMATGDSRLSVLLTIAHKGSIQCRATMRISFSPFLNLLLFTSGYIFFSSSPSVLLVLQTDPPPLLLLLPRPPATPHHPPRCDPHLQWNAFLFLSFTFSTANLQHPRRETIPTGTTKLPQPKSHKS